MSRESVFANMGTVFKTLMYELLQVSVKLPTYPSPKPTLTLTSHLRQNVGLREGQVGSFSETYNVVLIEFLSPPAAPTPVDGGLSQWSSCSQCSCNQVTNRTRNCTNPAPAFGGRPCQGHEMEHQFCRNTYCGKYVTFLDL